MENKTLKILVTGAAGKIGQALVFRLAAGEVFGPQIAVELHLLEIAPALPALQGVVMELEDCAFPLLKKIVWTADSQVAFHQVDWAILVGSAPRLAGMERRDLLQSNGKIFAAAGQALNDYAASNVRVLVVGNPCNTNCMIAMNHAPKIPKENFYAMTTLDQNRAVFQLASKVQRPVTSIKNVVIWGNHSATQFPDLFHATVDGRPASQLIDDHQWVGLNFVPTVQQRGAEIIKVKGSSSVASAASAIVDNLRFLVRETPTGEFFSTGICSQGQYGVDAGLIFSFPCRVEGGKVKIVEGLLWNEFSQQKITNSLEELRGEKKLVESMQLI